MSYQTTPIRGVRMQYGTRFTGNALGVIKTEGISNELSVDITGSDLIDKSFADVVVPAGSIIMAAYYETSEDFVIDADVDIGTKGSEATNGVSVTIAQAGAVGAGDITAALTGTWASGEALAADTTVGVAYAGTAPTEGEGRLRVTVVYKKLAAS